MVNRESDTSERSEAVVNSVRKPRGIQSVVIGFRILDCLAEADTPMGLKALSEAAEMPASKLRFYLISFLELGLVSQDSGSGYYSLGPTALRLGLSALEKVDVIRMARDEMLQLADAVGFTTSLAVWGTHGPTIVDRIDGRNRTVLELRVGSVLPLRGSATGRVFMAFMPAAVVAPVLRREGRQIAANGLPAHADPDASRKAIRAVRYARAAGTLVTEFTAVASPILDRAGTPVAVLSIVGAVGRLADGLHDQPAQMLLQLTTRLSRQLGWKERRQDPGANKG